MGSSSISIDLDDPRSGKIAEVIGSKSAKKILSVLAEEDELSGSDIAQRLGKPLNTVTYNLKKLVSAGLVERSKRVFWSSKGKKMELYKISRKRIVIEPKKLVRGVLPALVVSLIGALGIRLWHLGKQGGTFQVQRMVAEDSGFVESASSAASAAASSNYASKGAELVLGNSGGDVWLWFLAGALFALIVYLVWNGFVKKRRWFK